MARYYLVSLLTYKNKSLVCTKTNTIYKIKPTKKKLNLELIVTKHKHILEINDFNNTYNANQSTPFRELEKKS